jgi:hypothetical protein
MYFIVSTWMSGNTFHTVTTSFHSLARMVATTCHAARVDSATVCLSDGVSQRPPLHTPNLLDGLASHEADTCEVHGELRWDHEQVDSDEAEQRHPSRRLTCRRHHRGR